MYYFLSTPFIEAILCGLGCISQDFQFVELACAISVVRTVANVLFLKSIMRYDFALICTFIPFSYWYIVPSVLKYYLFPFYFKDIVIDHSLFFVFFITFLSYCLCNMIILLLKSVHFSRIKTRLFKFRSIPKIKINTVILFVLFILPIYPGNLFGSLLNLKTLAVRAALVESGLLDNKLGTVDKFFTALLGYVNVFIGIFFVMYGGYRTIKNKWYILYGSVILAVTVLLTGTRSYSFFLLVALWFVIYFNKIKINRSIIAVFFLSIFYFISLFGSIRGGYESDSKLTDTVVPLLVADNNFFDEFLFGVRFVEERGGYVAENPIYMFLTQFIPRFIWPEKPTSQIVREVTMDRWGIDPDKGAGNLLTGIFGQFYIGMGLLGIALCILLISSLSHYIRTISLKIESNNNPFENTIYITLLFVAHISSFRFFAQSNFMPLFASMAIIIILKITRLKNR